MSGGGKFQEEEEHENHERWLVTYADMITLLTCFFIMLYSMSVINLAKFSKLALSVRSGNNGQVKASEGMSIVEKGQVSTLPKPEAPEQLGEAAKALAMVRQVPGGANAVYAGPMEGTQELIEKLARELGKDASIKVTRTPAGWTLELAGDEIFFDTDSAELTDKARAALLELAPTLEKASHVQVEGYSSESKAGGFSLSSERALAVVDVLQQGQVEEVKLSATGFGVHAPEGQGGRDYVRILLKR